MTYLNQKQYMKLIVVAFIKTTHLVPDTIKMQLLKKQAIGLLSCLDLVLVVEQSCHVFVPRHHDHLVERPERKGELIRQGHAVEERD